MRLWLNQISPDNYEIKQKELRTLLFGDRKTKDEKGFDSKDSKFEFDEVKMNIVV